MDKSNEDSPTIRILGEEVSRRIAAGEVIERPFSVVRELLDNAVDAGASEISVYLKNGGADSIRVTDNGGGMSSADLRLCYLSHATSKISDLADLDTLSTLGFRGEALSSMAACARLEMISAPSPGQGTAHRLVVQGGKLISFEPYRGVPGTVVEVSHLFFNMPARKKFLKRTSAETSMCKAVFLDKALPFPRAGFRLYLDGVLKVYLESASLKQRVVRAYGYNEHEDLFLEAGAEAQGFSLKLVCAAPELYRKDRKHIQLFVNNRRIYEYSLMQAVEYGFNQFLPGGLFPVCFVFLQSDPALVDFNIHPAKKEVRLRNLPLIHQTLTTAVRNLLAGARAPRTGGAGSDRAGVAASSLSPPPELRFPAQHARFSSAGWETITAAAAASAAGQAAASAQDTAGAHGSAGSLPGVKQETAAQATAAHAGAPRYLGQLWNVFLVFVLGDLVYFVDQHAAHERLLFDILKTKPMGADALLIPISFTVEPEEGDLITKNREELKKAGIIVERIGPTSFELTTLPQSLHALPEKELIDFLKGLAGAGSDLADGLFARAACRLAIKEGQELDELTATRLVKGVLELENPRCPHGRPIFYTIKKSDLYKLTGRTV
jgi:DNA mismatch repair protein MutL